MILFGFFWVVILFFLPETRDTIISKFLFLAVPSPYKFSFLTLLCNFRIVFTRVLVMKKAKKLRLETGNPNIFADHEKDRASPGRLWKVSLLRPIKFLFTEPVSRVSYTANYRADTYELYPRNIRLLISQLLSMDLRTELFSSRTKLSLLFSDPVMEDMDGLTVES